MNTNKTTNRMALQYAIDNLPDAPTDIVEKWEKMLAALDKKQGTRKPTAKQNENAALRTVIVEYIKNYYEDGTDGFDCATLIKMIPELTEMNTQRVSAIIKPAIEAHELSKQVIKRKTYYVPYNPELVEVEG